MNDNIWKELTVMSVIFGLISVGMFIYFAVTSLRPMPIILSAVSAGWYYLMFEITSRHIK